jgi:hypothetical protein
MQEVAGVSLSALVDTLLLELQGHKVTAEVS